MSILEFSSDLSEMVECWRLRAWVLTGRDSGPAQSLHSATSAGVCRQNDLCSTDGPTGNAPSKLELARETLRQNWS